MSGLNRVTLCGYLGQDPELRHTATGQSVLSMRMATTEYYVKDGEKTERTEWHSVVCWGKLAEAISKMLVKGSRVLVEGRLQTRSWEKDGEKRYATEVNATNVLVLDSKASRVGDEDVGPAPRTRTRKPASSPTEPPADTFNEDDIPF